MHLYNCGVFMSISFKKIFGLSSTKSQDSVLTGTKVSETTAAVSTPNTAVKTEAPAKHGEGDVCCGSCSK